MAESSVSELVRTCIMADLIGDLVAETERAQDAREQGKVSAGPVTGLSALDEVLGGCFKPGVHIIQAAPGAGKTALCLQIATDAGCPVLVVSAEIAPLELVKRIVSRCSGTYLGRLQRCEIPAGEVRALATTAAKRAPHLALMDATLGIATAGEHILPATEALRERFGARDVMVIIDSLQVWSSAAGTGESEYEMVNAGLAAVRGIAARLACPILCVSHRNRPGQKAGGMHAGKGSGDLEYAAESLIELTLGDPYFDRPHIREATLGLHKNRHGEANKELKLDFEGRLQEFTDPAATVAEMRTGFLLHTNGRNGR